jgi:hypothetical protein
MSRIFWQCLFSIQVLFGILFYLLLVLLIFGHYYLDVEIHKILQDLEEQDFVQYQAGEQGKCSLTMLNLCAFSL